MKQIKIEIMDTKIFKFAYGGSKPKVSRKCMMTSILFFLLCMLATSVNAQGNYKLSRFFSEGYVENLFRYAHENAGIFNGIDVEDITKNHVTIRASFEPNFIGSTYVCTVHVYLDSKGRFIHVDNHCDSPSRVIWPCFDMATADLKRKCERNSHNREAIRFMEQYYGKSFRQFDGHEAMCTLLNIAWFNY